jgi:hypothetical protein
MLRRLSKSRRLRGIGAERLMPPGGENLPKTEPGYRQLLTNADTPVTAWFQAQECG